MSVLFTIQKSEEFTGATVLVDGQPYPVSSDHPSYEEIIEILLFEEPIDEDYLVSLLNPIQGVSDTLTRLSERVTIGGNVLYFDGDVIDGSLSDTIVRIFREGKEGRSAGYERFVKFLEKLATNPSEVSRQHLFDFATHHKLTITEDGDLLLYKSTQENGKATHAGYGIVTTPDGEVTTFTNEYLPNAEGYIVEIPRSMVDENRNAACSTGLHVGAFSYASSYSRILWNVKVNPRDVVSVPHDASSAKIRVARYEVLGRNEDKVEHEAPTINTVEEKLPGAPVVEEAPVPVATPKGGSRVDEYALLIQNGGAGTNLRKFRNKNVTAGRRAEFDQAVEQLGLSYN